MTIKKKYYVIGLKSPENQTDIYYLKGGNSNILEITDNIELAERYATKYVCEFVFDELLECAYHKASGSGMFLDNILYSNDEKVEKNIFRSDVDLVNNYLCLKVTAEYEVESV